MTVKELKKLYPNGIFSFSRNGYMMTVNPPLHWVVKSYEMKYGIIWVQL